MDYLPVVKHSNLLSLIIGHWGSLDNIVFNEISFCIIYDLHMLISTRLNFILSLPVYIILFILKVWCLSQTYWTFKISLFSLV